MRISDAQKTFLKEGLTELVLSRHDAEQFCETLLNLVKTTSEDFPTIFIMHFLTKEDDDRSALIPQLSIRKLSSMSLACARFDIFHEKGVIPEMEVKRVERVHSVYAEFFDEEGGVLP
jgi:hypothetical protein